MLRGTFALRGTYPLLRIGLLAAGVAIAGCNNDAPPPPSRIPPAHERTMERDEVKPLPDQTRRDLPAPPYADVPIVAQEAPEQRAFVDAYTHVGRPRITVFVNRTLEGELVPVNRDDPIATVEHSRRSNAGVSVERRGSSDSRGYYRDDHSDRSDRFESKGPAEYRETTDLYLHPGEYDETSARAVDYEAIENVLTDWLACDGKVEIISPMMVRQRLSDEQVKDLQNGRPRAMGEIARQLDADVLVQVQSRPTRQSEQGLAVRMIAEAINVKGGQSIARAVLDVPPPLEKRQINKYTRFMARKLMDGMIMTWQGTPDGGGAEEGDRNSTRPDDRATRPDVGSTRPETGPRGEMTIPRDEPVAPGRETDLPREAKPAVREETASPSERIAVPDERIDASRDGAITPLKGDASAPDGAMGADARPEVGTPIDKPATPPDRTLPPDKNPGFELPKVTPPDRPLPPDKGKGGDALPDIPTTRPTSEPSTRERENPMPEPGQSMPPATQERAMPQADVKGDRDSGDDGETALQGEGAAVRGFQRADTK